MKIRKKTQLRLLTPMYESIIRTARVCVSKVVSVASAVVSIYIRQCVFDIRHRPNQVSAYTTIYNIKGTSLLLFVLCTATLVGIGLRRKKKRKHATILYI